jgi:hypothetical protein
VPSRLATALKRKPCPTGESQLLPAHVPTAFATHISWTGLRAREQYCTTRDFYDGRHAHCLGSIAAYFADDVQLLGGVRPA